MALQESNSTVRNTLLPELYAVSAEDNRRLSDPEDEVLDHEDYSYYDAVRILTLNFGIAVAAYMSEEINTEHQYRTLITVATDTLEMARRIRPK